MSEKSPEIITATSRNQTGGHSQGGEQKSRDIDGQCPVLLEVITRLLPG